jgi:Rrf2 family iron-sulfur cluster assembly transcriptional regulator
MKIGTKGRYAVMAMIDMVKFGKEGAPIALSEIAARQEIALSYLEQLFCKLRRAGLVTSVRGVFGGYSLGRLPHEISIADIVEAADETLRFTRCHSNKKKGCMIDNTQCLSHHLWDALGNQMLFYLRGISLKDVLDKKVWTLPHAFHSTSNNAFQREVHG